MNDRLPPDVSPVVNESGIPIRPLYTEDDVAATGGEKRFDREAQILALEQEPLLAVVYVAAGVEKVAG